MEVLDSPVIHRVYPKRRANVRFLPQLGARDMTAAVRALVPGASARLRRVGGRHVRGIRVVVATQAVDAVPAASETKPTVTIRRAETRDVAQMTHILSEAADGAVSTQSLATYSREATSVEDTPGAAPEQLALVAECPFPSPSDPPRVVGVVGLLLDDSLKPMEMKLTKEVAYVTNLAVDASARRAGVGATLLAAAESCAQDYACVAVACRVDEGNDPALAMYDKKGYGPLVGRRLGQFRRLMGGMYAAAGVAHAVDLLLLTSALPTVAGAPVWMAMDPVQKFWALAWCAAGPLAWFCTDRGSPLVGNLSLILYGAIEVGLAMACAVAYGAVGGDAATGAVGVQVVVAGCALAMRPGPSVGRLCLGKELPSRAPKSKPYRAATGEEDEDEAGTVKDV